jgi:mRNA-degrading endonuclease toxin of MazEF toxin-antitoxin module
MRYSFGDIVLVPFPFTDQSVSKKRPAVVVSSSAYHQARPDLVIMAVTSQLRPSAHFGEVMDGAGLAGGGVAQAFGHQAGDYDD